MKIVADENIYQVKQAFSPFGEVVLKPGRSICRADLIDANALLVRSVTQVNESLLEGTSIGFVASATIGVDHIDQTWLANRGIQFAYAPGCNANAVVQYVLSAMAILREDWQDKTVGIIGCGNVGGRLAKLLMGLGINYICYDPYLTVREQSNLVELDEVLSSDVVTLHTPLTHSGRYPTFHLLGETNLAKLKRGALLINSSRGAVVDNQALLPLLQQGAFECVLDVWESEPDIPRELLAAVTLGTPHIAGYSLDGKLNGTLMILDAFRSWLGGVTAGQEPRLETELHALNPASITEAILAVYDLREDDKALRQVLAGTGQNTPDTGARFDRLRKEYNHRLEFQHYRIGKKSAGGLAEKLSVLGFVC